MNKHRMVFNNLPANNCFQHETQSKRNPLIDRSPYVSRSRRQSFRYVHVQFTLLNDVIDVHKNCYIPADGLPSHVSIPLTGSTVVFMTRLTYDPNKTMDHILAKIRKTIRTEVHDAHSSMNTSFVIKY